MSSISPPGSPHLRPAFAADAALAAQMQQEEAQAAAPGLSGEVREGDVIDLAANPNEGLGGREQLQALRQEELAQPEALIPPAPRIENPVLRVAAGIGGCIFLTAVVLVIIPFLLVYKIGKEIFESIGDTVRSVKERLFPEEQIPEEWHGDALFAENQCAILHVPVRFPVRDMNYPQHVFERSALVRWVTERGTNPMNRQRLPLAYIERDDELQARIEARLAELRAGAAIQPPPPAQPQPPQNG